MSDLGGARRARQPAPRGKRTRDIVVSPRGMAPLVQRGLEEVRAAPPAGLSREEANAHALFRNGLAETLALARAAEDRGEVMFVANHEPTSLLQTFLAREAETHREALEREGGLRELPDGTREVRFDSADLAGWLQSFAGWWRGLLDRHPWQPPAPEPYRQLGDVARIALLGDWGTGMYGAPVCASSVEAARPAFDVIVHLGDVYYSGTKEEMERHFLALWPRVPGALSIALNSNHDMYSGGAGYFETALRSSLFRQPSSVVAIENEHFVIACLDTGYVSGDLAGEQAAWLSRLSDRAELRGQRLVVLSHHPPFSLFDSAADRLVGRLAGLLSERRIFAWYWGHEHRAVMYDLHESWRMYGRCIGHSGFPYHRDDLSGAIAQIANPDGSTWLQVIGRGAPDGWILDGPNPFVPGHERRYGPHGYASLILDGPHLHETVHTALGAEIWSQQLV